jgi:hypothetical protein
MIGTRIPAVALFATLFVAAGWGPSASAQEDAEGTGPGFKEGDIITYENLDVLEDYLPDPFWDNRDFFFYEGMQLEIGPFFRDYSGPGAYKAATQRGRGQARIGPDNSLENFESGRPFPMD